MKSKNLELTEKFLILIKIDTENLYQRIKEREKVYMEYFSAKRDREIFKEVFFSRYKTTSMSDLATLPIEIIELSNDFYTKVDELYWYLMHTEDMPNAIEDEVIRQTNNIRKKLYNLNLYISAELSGESVVEENISENFNEQEDQFQELDSESQS